MDDLNEIKQRIATAHTEICEIAEQGVTRRWRMHIPAQPDRDSDLIISRALKDAEDLVAAIERVRTLAERWENALAVDAPYARAIREALAVRDHPTPAPPKGDTPPPAHLTEDWRERARARVGDRVAARMDELMAEPPMSADEFDEAMRRNRAEAEAYLDQQSRRSHPTGETS